MRQTLFFIPHELAGVPVFGFGWLLLLWAVGGLATLLLMLRQQGWNKETRGFLQFYAVVAAAIAFVLPIVEIPRQGLPIRGYGVMLLLATVLGVMLAVHRAKQVRLAPEVIVNLAFHMFVGGIVGARVFYVVQYWDRIHDPSSWLQTLGNIVNFVEGGLVVYGSLIGALVAGLWFVRKQRLPALAVGDLIAPSLALGLAIGRLGCLMNGCCYGDRCDHAWGVSFPSGSPPYYDQHRSGLLYGFRVDVDVDGYPVVAWVDPQGPAAASDLPAGAQIKSLQGNPVHSLEDVRDLLGRSDDVVALTTNQGDFSWSIGALPARSLPVHPTQIYSSLNAALLCLLTYAFFPFRRRDGEVFALLMGLYAISRFLLEIIRTDEVKNFAGTGLTISQNVSIVVLAATAVLVVYLSRQPKGSYWPRS